MEGLQQQEIIERLSKYLKQCIVTAIDNNVIDSNVRDDYLDGLLTGMSMAIGIASGIEGPIDGRTLAHAGADIALAADHIEKGPSWL